MKYFWEKSFNKFYIKMKMNSIISFALKSEYNSLEMTWITK